MAPNPNTNYDEVPSESIPFNEEAGIIDILNTYMPDEMTSHAGSTMGSEHHTAAPHAALYSDSDGRSEAPSEFYNANQDESLEYEAWLNFENHPGLQYPSEVRNF